ncbi:MAG: DEAD/DEAH box helicase family protein [Crocinitomicaceae bacterium]|nr:DEAD/DEAH box helicase family protein [Crocinitomicaceae bacterium]
MKVIRNGIIEDFMLNECNSWSDFQGRLEFLDNKKKGNAFELLTKLYFKINPVYSFYDEVWLFDELPTKELEYLELPTQDLGIDLIAKYGNEYHAIQCKYHSDKTSSVTFKEVSTFISLLESNDKITQGYICSSADLTSRNFNKLKTKPINLIMSDSWQLLDEEFFNDVRKTLEGKKVKYIPFQPRPHQKKALKKSKNYFIKEDCSRGKLIFPCGAGKSLTGFWMTQELKSKSTIIAVPSLSLVKQTLEVYLREIVAKDKRIKWLCICSDEGIGKNDDVAIFTENLGVPCQTDPSYIEQWLKENIDEEKIIFTTYQSGRIIAEISKRLNFKFDVGIFDEAHKTVGSNKKLFSHLLFEENISIEKRIFMTATERFYVGSKDDIISMDDEDIYGDTFTQMSFKEAIEIGLLTDYKVITIDIKKSEIAEFIRDNNLLQLNDKWKKETEARSLASMLALRKAMKRFSIKNAVSFHSSIEKAVRNKELQKYITETYNYTPIDTYTVSGKQSTSKRNDIVQEFAKSPKALITNARCLTEGVDVPNIDCILFADPRKSRVDIVQALGRALRRKEGKDWGYVVLPVIYDEETQTIDNDSFNEILSIVRGLASNDERIVDYFKDKNQKEGRKKKETSEQFNFEVFSDYIDEEQLSEQLQIRLWDKMAKFNWLSYTEAKSYVHKLHLKSVNDWRTWAQSSKRPFNIPSQPNKVYENSGWVSWGVWTGTFRKSNKTIKYLDYESSKKFASSLGLKSEREWRTFLKTKKSNLPENIPASPHHIYKNLGWKGYSAWFGFESNYTRSYFTYEEAKSFVHKLHLKSGNDWHEYYNNNRPSSITKYPDQTYKNKGWVSWGEFLGSGSIADRYKEFRDFDSAKKFVHKLNLKSRSEWEKYVNGEFIKLPELPLDIPKTPHYVYKNNGWISVSDWLGNVNLATRKREYLHYDKAKQFVQSLGLKSQTEWSSYCTSGKKPVNIPRSVSRTYKNEWKSWGEFLGTGRVADQKKVFISFVDAKKFALSLGLKNQKEWIEWKKENKRPKGIPAQPNLVYKDKGWKGYVDFLRND